MDIKTGKPSAETLDYLLTRRSVKKGTLVAPAPDAAALEKILMAAARVPDHGKLCPFYFIVFEGEARKDAGEIVARRFVERNPDARADKIEVERNRFVRAPMVVAIVSRARRSKHPLWEQLMSAGAVAQNFSLAAHASGYGVIWLSEWYAFDEEVKRAFGLDARDHIVGFMHVGTVSEQPEERERPDLDKILTHWSAGVALNKGDADYDRTKLNFPVLGARFMDGNS